MLEKIKQALGLKPEATEAEVEEALTALVAKAGSVDEAVKTAVKAKDDEIATLKKADDTTPLAEFRAKAIEAVGLKADAKDEEFSAELLKLKAIVPEAEKAKTLEAKVADLEKFREDVRIERLMASVDEHITPALKADIEKLARTVPETLFLSTVKAMPKVKAAPETPAAGAESDVLASTDREYLMAQGLTPESEKWKRFVDERKREIAEKAAR